MDGCGPQMDITQMQQNGQPVSSSVVPGTVNSNPSLERGLLSRDCDQFMENSRLRLSAWPPRPNVHSVSCSSTMVPQEDNVFQNIDLGNDWLSGIEASAPLEENCDLTPRPIEHMLHWDWWITFQPNNEQSIVDFIDAFIFENEDFTCWCFLYFEKRRMSNQFYPKVLSSFTFWEYSRFNSVLVLISLMFGIKCTSLGYLSAKAFSVAMPFSRVRWYLQLKTFVQPAGSSYSWYFRRNVTTKFWILQDLYSYSTQTTRLSLMAQLVAEHRAFPQGRGFSEIPVRNEDWWRWR